MLSQQIALSASLCQAARNAEAPMGCFNKYPNPNLVQNQPISPVEQDDSTTGGRPQPQAWAARSGPPGPDVKEEQLCCCPLHADSIPLQQPPALPAWPQPCSPSRFRAPRPGQGASREGHVLKWLFTAGSRSEAELRSQQTRSFASTETEGVVGRRWDGTYPNFLFSGRARAPSAADCSENRRAGNGVVPPEDSDLLSKGTAGFQMSPLPGGLELRGGWQSLWFITVLTWKGICTNCKGWEQPRTSLTVQVLDSFPISGASQGGLSHTQSTRKSQGCLGCHETSQECIITFRLFTGLWVLFLLTWAFLPRCKS